MPCLSPRVRRDVATLFDDESKAAMHEFFEDNPREAELTIDAISWDDLETVQAQIVLWWQQPSLAASWALACAVAEPLRPAAPPRSIIESARPSLSHHASGQV